MLSTGLVGQTGSTLTTIGGQDDLWRVTFDPVNNANLPRPAVVVANTITPGLSWPPPLANSQWISPHVTKYSSALPPGVRTLFTYSANFSLPACTSPPQLTLELRADDVIRRVVLNNVQLYSEPNPGATANTVATGSHMRPPLSITHSSNETFKPTNRLDVVVEDTGQTATGLNVLASVSYQEAPCPDPGGRRGAPR